MEPLLTPFDSRLSIIQNIALTKLYDVKEIYPEDVL